MDLCEMRTIEIGEQAGKEIFAIMLHHKCSYFRVKDVQAFIEAMADWKFVVVEEGNIWSDQVTLDVILTESEIMDNDLEYMSWPMAKGDDRSIGTFDMNFLTTIQAHLRPKQVCSLYEVGYNCNDEDYMRLAVIPSEGKIQQTDLGTIMETNGNTVGFHNHITYPGDANYGRKADWYKQET